MYFFQINLPIRSQLWIPIPDSDFRLPFFTLFDFDAWRRPDCAHNFCMHRCFQLKIFEQHEICMKRDYRWKTSYYVEVIRRNVLKFFSCLDSDSQNPLWGLPFGRLKLSTLTSVYDSCVWFFRFQRQTPTGIVLLFFTPFNSESRLQLRNPRL